jgi:orotidine 5'-phosphate decarboxylase subfamily 2
MKIQIKNINNLTLKKQIIMKRNFRTLLLGKWKEGKFLCAGPDTEFGKIPEDFLKAHPGTKGAQQLAYNKWVIDQTHDIIAAYKLNFAFYFALGVESIQALIDTVKYIKEINPTILIILDMKIGDIGETNAQYVIGVIDQIGADAVTVSPYPGPEALKPFFEKEDLGVIVLCRTSNKHSDRVQKY